jgi:hypothetical protein
MTYTINGKEWTEDEINNAITEIRIAKLDMDSGYNRFMAEAMRLQPLCYTRNPLETDAIIDMCWDELTLDVGYDGEEPQHYSEVFGIKWNYIMKQHNCTKLVAACICYIEINEAES